MWLNSSFSMNHQRGLCHDNAHLSATSFLIYANPVNSQFRGQLLGIAHRSYPRPSELIGEYEIEWIVGPRKLIFFLGKTGIGHRLLVVDEEADAVRIHLNGIHVPVADLYVCHDIVRGNVFFLDMKRVMGVHSLIGFRI